MANIAELKAELQAALDRLDEVAESRSEGGPAFEVLSETGRLGLAALGGTVGECRRETPYASLQPIIDADGNLQWCCTHASEHCVS